MIILFVYRIVFLTVYSYRIEKWVGIEILKAMVTGFRFDFSVTCAALFPFFLLSQISRWNKNKFYTLLWSIAPALLSVWMVLHLAGDVIYFEHANKHVGYEGFVSIGKDIFLLFYSVFLEKPILFSFTFMLVFIYISLLYFFVLDLSHLHIVKETTWKQKFFTILSISIISIIGIRGGIQASPLKPSAAIISKNHFINNLALNGVFTTAYDLGPEAFASSHKLKSDLAVALVRQEIEYSGAEFISNEYPLLRKSISNPKTYSKSPNIVLVIMESWPSKYIFPSANRIIDGKEVTPFFNSLIDKGIYFKNFFATGGRTTNGLIASLTGIPDRPGISALHTHYSLANFSGVGSIMKKIGYKTFFITGSNLAFENIEPHISHWGFENIISEKDLKEKHKEHTGVWGVDDKEVFMEAHSEFLNAEESPFFSVILTISTHHPYIISDEKFKIYSKDTKDFEFLNALHYADYAIENFISNAQSSPYFKNTIFLFVADHTHHKYLNYYEDRNIPFLIYSPGNIAPDMKSEIGGQLDIIPTIIGLTGKEILFSAMGKDILSPNAKNTSYFAYGNLFGWIEKELFYVINTDSARSDGRYTMNYPFGESSACEWNPALCKSNGFKAKAFLTLSSVLMEKNKIFPLEEKE